MREDTQTSQIQRVFAFAKSLGIALCMLGTALVRYLLCNIYRRNEALSLKDVQSAKPSISLKGRQSRDNFIESCSNAKHSVSPHI